VLRLQGIVESHLSCERTQRAYSEMTTRLEVALGNRYRLRGEIGRGGMAIVYLADDLKHARQVAVKVLHPDLATALGGERFIREITLAASLIHPNIVPLLDSAAVGDCLYYVMPCVEGESLRQRLTREIQLPVEEAVQIARDVVAALRFAHAHRIVHRDVKPENILLTGRSAVLADFGIALILESSSADARLTATGITLGTPAYMSPEQAYGGHVDARSDLYSLACVLYEMLAGQCPFGGPTAQAILSRHAVDPVPPIRSVRPTVSTQLAFAINRALAKTPADRFQTAAEFDEAMARGLHGSGAAGMSVEQEKIGRQGSVAVIPFVNVGIPEDEYFADGMTEELIGALGTLDGLRVVARTSSFAFKGKRQDVRAIGEALSAGLVVEGSVRRSGSRVRILVQMVDASDGTQVWSAAYDRGFDDILAIQEELSRTIIEALKTRITHVPLTTTVQLPEHPSDIEAYELYLKGRFLWNKRERTSVEKAISYFERAISRAPSYGKPYVGLADSLIVLASSGVLAPKDVFPRAKVAIEHALAIDEMLPEAHFSMANVAQSFDWDWATAEEWFKRGLALGPSYATGQQWYGLHLAAMRRSREAVSRIEQALHLDPLSPIIASSLGIVLYYAREPRRAAEAFLSALDLDPNFVPAKAGLGEAYAMVGQEEPALRELRGAVEASARNSQILARLAVVYGVFGRRAEADQILNELYERSASVYVPAYSLAAVLASLRRPEHALLQLEKAYEERADWLMDLSVDPAFDVLRGESQFIALLARLNLPLTASLP
jgi:eukaryotic-like serine/threonine-protein kinase